MKAPRPGDPACPVRTGLSMTPPFCGVTTWSVKISEYLPTRVDSRHAVLRTTVQNFHWRLRPTNYAYLFTSLSHGAPLIPYSKMQLAYLSITARSSLQSNIGTAP